MCFIRRDILKKRYILCFGNGINSVLFTCFCLFLLFADGVILTLPTHECGGFLVRFADRNLAYLQGFTQSPQAFAISRGSGVSRPTLFIFTRTKAAVPQLRYFSRRLRLCRVPRRIRDKSNGVQTNSSSPHFGIRNRNKAVTTGKTCQS